MNDKQTIMRVSIPSGIKNLIEKRARENFRTRNAEIVYRLYESLEREGDIRIFRRIQYINEMDILKKLGTFPESSDK